MAYYNIYGFTLKLKKKHIIVVSAEIVSVSEALKKRIY